MTVISGMGCVLKFWTVLLCGSLSTSKTTSRISPLSAPSYPVLPHYIKPSHAESPFSSLSPTCTSKTPSSWKQFFVCCISLSQQFSGQLCTALVTPCPGSMPGPFLPTRTPLLLIWESLTILMVTITPLCQFYIKATWILHLNVQSLQISVQSHFPGPKSFYRLKQQWRGTGAFSEGSVSASELQGELGLLRKDSLFSWHGKDHLSPVSCWEEEGPCEGQSFMNPCLR